jgi:intracellular septation protein A
VAGSSYRRSKTKCGHTPASRELVNTLSMLFGCVGEYVNFYITEWILIDGWVDCWIFGIIGLNGKFFVFKMKSQSFF